MRSRVYVPQAKAVGKDTANVPSQEVNESRAIYTSYGDYTPA